MLRNYSINLHAIHTIALALGELNESVAFVGGAVLNLYVNDPAAEDVRPTKDVDIVIEVASSYELETIRKKLTDKGFKQSPNEPIMCRFIYHDIKVDVMSTKAIDWAPANPWFEQGFQYLEDFMIENITIHILPVAYFLASKFKAFQDRGTKEPRTSHDFEDIVYILDHCSDLVEVIRKTPGDARNFLKTEFTRILHEEILIEAILSNLSSETQEKRFQLIKEKLNEIVNSI